MRPVPLIAILIGMFSLYLKITILSQMLLNKGILKGFCLIKHQSQAEIKILAINLSISFLNACKNPTP
ncbi:hypothetical protein ECC26_05130 [Helicobacter pylori]|nr:hypothetical protein [Helicobacter pylori]NHB12733.1 hypothetical protein [Helicobacter pylori]QEE96701.1 hypothetical protein D2C89_01800 [Helicobacter pylori]QEE98522.1 hypothetical protein D2C88_03755 [Helicobacter pylori]QEF38165.1 hypothetical protein D2C76_05460 [Helicobacter pylori]